MCIPSFSAASEKARRVVKFMYVSMRQSILPSTHDTQVGEFAYHSILTSTALFHFISCRVVSFVPLAACLSVSLILVFPLPLRWRQRSARVPFIHAFIVSHHASMKDTTPHHPHILKIRMHQDMFIFVYS
jgi:hypothetical protein